ncbi:MAG: hypothetical protein BroJett040_21020 [Oligoflexia bacterium]|nr:MAG: hypothetical protein BroJett040_21020 [Oligoflexia bacterium]
MKTLLLKTLPLLLICTSSKAYDPTSVNNAIEMDNVSTIASLVESGQISINEKIPAPGYGKGAPLITLAARSASLKVLTYLINHKADLNAKTPVNETALMLASFFKDEDGSYEPGYKQHEKAVQLLVQAGANLENDIGSYTPLSYAAYQGHIRIVKYLTSKGANIDGNAVNGENNVNTPLMMSVLTDQQEVVIHLLRLGADVKITKGTESAITFAKKYNRTKMLNYLTCAERLNPGQKFSEVCE